MECFRETPDEVRVHLTSFESGKIKRELWRPFEETTPPRISYFAPFLPLNLPTTVRGSLFVPKPLYPSTNSRLDSPSTKTGMSGKKANLLPSSGSSFLPVKRKRVHCPHCPSKFFNNGQLTGHMAVHTGDRPFRCDFGNCPRAFARNEELTRHRRIHTGDKPHGCDLCSKRFGRKDHLSKHRRTHQRLAEKKVHLCPIVNCGHSYTRSDALARHIGASHSKLKGR